MPQDAQALREQLAAEVRAEAIGKPLPKITVAYVVALEERVAELEAQVRQIAAEMKAVQNSHGITEERGILRQTLPGHETARRIAA